MSAKPFVAQWGILGCGWISSEFTKDLVLDPSTRKVTDISHAIAAVGSRTKSKAEDFIGKYCPKGACGQQTGLVAFEPKAYGSYKEVVEDGNVNVVYVGTMNISHYDDAKLVLEGGKHCLLEKPATLNAAEWKALSALAKEKKVFLMEAVWTRFNPTMLAVQKAIHEDNVIGDIQCLYSDMSMDTFGKQSDKDRVTAAEHGRGALADLGTYPMVWSMMILYRHPKNQMTPPDKVGSTMLLHHGVDVASSFAMTFPKINAIAHCSTNELSSTDLTQHTRIVGSTGEIIVQGYTARPVSYIIRRPADPTQEGGKNDENVDLSFEGFGLFWEADAVARCLKDGLLECPEMRHDETQMTMEICDQIRKEGGYKYLPGLERVPLK